MAHELRECGFQVIDLSRLGDDVPDMLIGKHGVYALLEAKTPRGRKTAVEQLSAGQIQFRSQCKGPLIVAHTASAVRSEFALLLKRREAWAL
jgi:Holliday junction resolvase